MVHRVLIVEDERALAHALELKLKAAGIDVEIAADGEAGLTKIRQNDYDLLLLDLIIPKVDGFKVLEELRRSGRNVRVIALSNLSQEEDVERAKRLGVSDYFLKADTPLSVIIARAVDLLP